MLIPRIDFPELFFGFVAPIGADLDRVVAAFKNYFRAQEYEVFDVKVTDIYKVLKTRVTPKEPLNTSTPQARSDSYIKYGDQLRAEFEDDSFLAVTTIANIIRKRQKSSKPGEFQKKVYLLHQFKRKEEISLLRDVYGENFYQVSVYSRRGARVENLARKFAAGQYSANLNQFRAQAENLVQTDENEGSHKHGQQVAKIFHDADFIVNLDQHSPSAENQVTRFCEILFGSNTISPTKMEYGMYLARGAALRSIDLSRQVGACIMQSSGQVVSLGANEVPKATGGTYWSDEKYDDRDYARGVDSNEARKREILSELLRALNKDLDIEEALKHPLIKDSQLMDALEYTRVIHGEMNALCDAAIAGHSCKGATLYVTTFPCHLCAKHVVAAGLSQVVFLEPYPKSLTAQLHNDSVQIEGGDRGSYSEFPCVQFVHFFGVTPPRYQFLFGRGRRKTGDGKLQEYRAGQKSPLLDTKIARYTGPEDMVLRAQSAKYKARFGVDDLGDPE